jgi:phospholipid transport system substrate-binding protein
MLNDRLDRHQVILGSQLALLTLLVGRRPAAAAISPDAAQAMIQDVGGKVLAVLRDPALSNDEKFTRLVDLLDGPIDLNLVARLILGRHWRTASGAQQEEYLKLFRAFALDNLASRLHVYDGQDFEIVSAKAVNDSDAVVSTRVIGGDHAPLKVDWRIRERDDGDLVAIDVIVEGVSMIVTQRSEFSSVIERQGMDGLLAELRQRS